MLKSRLMVDGARAFDIAAPLTLSLEGEGVEGGAVAPPAADVPPAADGGTLLTEGEAPPAEGEAPPAEGDQPPADGEAPPAEGEDGEDEVDPNAPPEDYTFEFAEGTTIDDEAVGQLKDVAKELGLSQENAQKFASLAESMANKWAEGLNQHVLDTRTGWRDAVRTDAEIGGDKLAENLAVAKSAIETFGTPELKKMLDDVGIGDNPEFIRFAYRVGKANSEHDLVKSGKPASEVSFYDHPTSKPRK